MQNNNRESRKNIKSELDKIIFIMNKKKIKS